MKEWKALPQTKAHLANLKEGIALNKNSITSGFLMHEQVETARVLGIIEAMETMESFLEDNDE